MHPHAVRFCHGTLLLAHVLNHGGVVNTFDPLLIETSRPAIASLLKKHGFATGFVGKWHLGYGTAHNPREFGLEEEPGTPPINRHRVAQIAFAVTAGAPTTIRFTHPAGSAAATPAPHGARLLALQLLPEPAADSDKARWFLRQLAEAGRPRSACSQPSARVAWDPSDRHTWWAAASRAARSPSRLDRDRHITPLLAGSPNFVAEELLAWEAGWRTRPHERLSFAWALFYHDYDDIRSIERTPAGSPAPRVIGNGQEGRSHGIEVTADYQVTKRWRAHLGVTEIRVRIKPKPGSTDRLAWRPLPQWEFAIAGQNLLHGKHVEYGDSTMRYEVARRVYLTVR